jgi:hypothetical protein
MRLFKRVLALGVFLLTGFSFSSFAQTDTINLNSLVANAASTLNKRPIEKAYVHFDKPYYAVGDTIWFKAYITVDIHLPTALSKIAYLDVFNSRDSLMTSLRLPLNNGVAAGFIPLTMENYTQGSYHVRAYTSWMANSSPAFFFNKTINIGNAIDKPMNTNITFTSTTVNNLPKVTARILFTDASGVPQVGRKIDWRVVNKKDDSEIKGKGETDKNGYATIVFTSKQPDLSDAALVATLDLADHKTFTRSFSLAVANGQPDVQFFPEAGQFISGVLTKVAVKAVDTKGLGLDIKGQITDNNNTVVATFASQHLGMGSFRMTPEAGKTYKASVTFPDGSKQSYDLPTPETEGLTLQITNNDPEKLNVKIIANDAYFQGHKNQKFYLLLQSNGYICYAAQSFLQQQFYNAAIPKNKFPTGIVQISLLSDTRQTIAERLAFIDRHDQLKMAMSSDKPIYGVRQHVRLNISSKLVAAPVTGNFSVAVIDETKVPYDENAETTILSSLLLTSDLKGYVEKPNYYFNHPNDKTADDLDLLMMTQGFRRLNYRDLLNGKLSTIYSLPEQGIEISGILRSGNGMPIKNGPVALIIPDKHFSTSTISDPDGKFKFTNLMFTDSSQVILRTQRNYVITVDGDMEQRATPNYTMPDEIVNLDSTMHTYLQNSKHQYSTLHQLKEVVIKGSVQPKASHLDYPALTGLNPVPDHLITGDKFAGCNDFLSCLQTAALGVTYVDNNFYVTRDYNQGNKTPMQVFVKGMPVDVSYLASLNAADVESVEVFLKDDLGLVNRTYNTNGVLVINTKKAPKGTKVTLAELRSMLPQPNVVNLTPKGYALVKEFYSPKYLPGKTSSIALGMDLRTTIYWNPKVITDAAGNATVDFYNADGRGTYKAVIEGFDKDGNLGRYVYKYKVE